MFAYEKFDLYDEIVGCLSESDRLTYSPLIRETFLFCLQDAAEKDRRSGVDKLNLSGVSHGEYPEKRPIGKVGYFADDRFLKNVLKGFSRHGVDVEKLDFVKPRFKKVMSNKQKEEVCFFDSKLLALTGRSLRKHLEERFYFLNGQVAAYYRKLKESSVDAVVLRVYYGLGYFPVILACKMLGITVIDVQHGINGFRHPAYSKFKRGEAYSPLLPDVFWTWGRMASSMLMKDSQISLSAHVIEGGNPVFSSKSASGGARRSGKGNRRTRILYTHQPQSKGIPIPYDEIKKVHAEKGGEVIIRPHPLHIDEAFEVKRALGRSRVESSIEDSRKVSINESLSKVDVHVTYSSTCALDALNFGIPSVYCSDYIGDVEREFNTGLLFRAGETSRKDLTRKPEKAVDYSLGSKEKVNQGVTAILNLSSC